MAYRSTEKTRAKKDAKRTAMMQASVRVFAKKGYHAATVRDVVKEAGVSVGTFYFYFPDKETLFVHLYEETADFLLKSIQQAVNGPATLPKQISNAIQTYLNIAIYEPAIVRLLLLGGMGAVPALYFKRTQFREKLTQIWQQPLDEALDKNLVAPQNTRRTAEALAGAFDEIILNLLSQPSPEREAKTLAQEMTVFALRAVAYTGVS